MRYVKGFVLLLLLSLPFIQITYQTASFSDQKEVVFTNSQKVIRTNQPQAIIFVTPDCSYKALEYIINSANVSIHIMIYEMWSRDVAELLANASLRGVDVKIVFEGNIYGAEYSKNMSAMLYELSRGTIGPNDLRFENSSSLLHAKVIIVDNKTVLITSENIFPTSFPRDPTQIDLKPYSTASRGWGIILFNSTIAQQLESVFLTIFNNYSVPYNVSDVGLEPTSQGVLYYQPQFDLLNITDIKYASLVMTLGYNSSVTSNGSIATLIDSAKYSIFMEQMYIYNATSVVQDLINRLANAVSRGVTIQLIMEDDIATNYDSMSSYLESLGIHTARAFYYDPGVLFLHNKGMLVDNDGVLIGSINWSGTAMLNNTEVGIIIRSEQANSYYYRVFGYDWEKSTNSAFDSDGDGLSDIYEREHNLNPLSKDSDGDGLSDYDEIYVYGTDPLVSQEINLDIISPANGEYLATTNVNISWTASNGEYLDYIEIYINNTLYGSTYKNSIVLNLHDQAYNVIKLVPIPKIPAIANSKSIGIYVDSMPPNITIDGALNGSLTNNSQFRLTANISDYSLDKIEVRINGSIVIQNKTVDNKVMLNVTINLNNGTNIIEIIATDKAGNQNMIRLLIVYQPAQNASSGASNQTENITEKYNINPYVLEFHRFFGILMVSILLISAVILIIGRKSRN